ncbi:MAG: hypothetical protein ABSG76_13355 [Xanthobacteraceae bacterium]|jgi:molecular chaperone GrpE
MNLGQPDPTSPAGAESGSPVDPPAECPAQPEGGGNPESSAGAPSHAPDQIPVEAIPPETDVVALLTHMERRIIDSVERQLAADAFRERQVDRLHAELQGYKSDLLAKAARPVIAALIKLHGDVTRLRGALGGQNPDKLTVEKVAGLFDSFRDEIEDLLRGLGVSGYRDEADDRFDPKRQSAAGVVETTDHGLVGRVAERLRSGFEQGNAVIEKERVKVFVAARTPAPGAADNEGS